MHTFVFKPDDDYAAQIIDELASAKYRTIRAGIDARLPISFVAIVPRFSYLGPLTPSDDSLYARFRDASLKAIELGLDLAFVLPKGFELRAGVDYTRYFASFSPQTGDAYVASGAVDQFIALKLFALYRY